MSKLNPAVGEEGFVTCYRLSRHLSRRRKGVERPDALKFRRRRSKAEGFDLEKMATHDHGQERRSHCMLVTCLTRRHRGQNVTSWFEPITLMFLWCAVHSSRLRTITMVLVQRGTCDLNFLLAPARKTIGEKIFSHPKGTIANFHIPLLLPKHSPLSFLPSLVQLIMASFLPLYNMSFKDVFCFVPVYWPPFLQISYLSSDR